MTLVVDSSVAVKWYVPEDLTEAAIKFKEWAVVGGHRLYAPEYFLVEVAAVLWKKAGILKQISVDEAGEIFREMGGAGVNLAEDRILLEEALGIALASGVTVYDSLYLSLAGKTGTCFVTADTKLQRKCASKFRIVNLHNWEKDLKRTGKDG